MADESEQIKQLYEYAEQLDKAGEAAKKHVDLYTHILNASKQGHKVKSFAAQFIPRYFKYFPELLDPAIDALTDLCEEEDMQIRILAVRAFPQVCKELPSAVPKAADILGQLLQTENMVEQDNVKNSLVALLHIDAAAVVKAMFNQIRERDEVQRERGFQFLRDKVYPLRKELLHPHPEVEKQVAEEFKKALLDVSGYEFKICMDFMSDLKIYKENAKELLDILAAQADLTSDFKATDVENIERLVSCMHMALPMFKKGATQSGQTFLNYLANKVLPSFSQLHVDHQSRLLQAVAEISPYAVADDARILLPAVYALIKLHVPAGGKDADASQINFTYIEGLLFTFHYLGSKAPGAVAQLCGITPVYTGQPSDMVIIEDAEEKFKDFKARLSFLVDKTEKTINDTKKAIQGVQLDQANSKSINLVLTTTKNVHDLAKLLDKKPKPSFLSTQTITPSWQTEKQKKQKRKQPETQPNTNQTDTKKSKGYGGVYTPPGRQQPKGVAATDNNQQHGGFKNNRGRGNQRGGQNRGGQRGGFNRGRGRGRY